MGFEAVQDDPALPLARTRLIPRYAEFASAVPGTPSHGRPKNSGSPRITKKANTVFVNDVIANAFFKGGRTEGWGRGILDIFTLS